MNNRAKGKLHERNVAKYLRSQGYLVEVGFGKPGWTRKGLVFCDRDLFDFCDVLAIKVPNEVRFIQVTSGNASPRKKKAFSVWPNAEVWKHVVSGVYRVYRVGSSRILDTKKTSLC